MKLLMLATLVFFALLMIEVGAQTITGDILSYYRSLGSNPNVIETTDLLKAADDWSSNTAPPGFASPITTQHLLTLADEWSRPTYRIYGLDFSPYMDRQNPNLGSQISEEQLRARLTIIAPYTQWIRTFSSTHGLEKTGPIAHEMGLKAAIGAWLGKDLSTNELEISNLIEAAKAGDVDLAIVGSEVLLRGDLSESQLIGYINRVKNEVPGIQVTTADTYGEILSHPSVISAVDSVFVNYYPYWEGIRIDHSIAAIHGWHQLVSARANGKPIFVSETGWPSCGNLYRDIFLQEEMQAGKQQKKDHKVHAGAYGKKMAS
jgi:exo-beta-1,3-glucanase (GH17 family)